MGDSSDENTKAALLSVVAECLSHPDKQKDFVEEGCVDLLLGLCSSKNNIGVNAIAAGALAVLCHQNSAAKAKIVGHGGVTPLLSLCSAQEREQSNLGDPSNANRLLSHEYAAAVLQKLAFENTASQGELVGAGAIRHLIKLCDVFNPDGSHGNCCQVINEYSAKANKMFSESTRGQKLIGAVKELGEKDMVRTAIHLLHTGLDINVLSGLFNKIHQVKLFDTTQPGIDILVAKELIDKGLAWPDLSQQDKSDARRDSKQDKENNENWNDISIQEVIDAGHFWAHVGGKVVVNRIEEIQKFLHAQPLEPLSCSPEPGDIVCVSASTSGHKDHYRACVVDYTSTTQESKAKVFAIDNGFTAIVPGSTLFALPRELAEYKPQISLCSLAGVQASPRHAAVLEYALGALRNLCHDNVNNIAFIATAGGIEAVLKLCSIPSKTILLQALGALLNLTADYKYRARIGFLGGIKTLLDICEKYTDDEDILILSLRGLQAIMADCIINRSRMAEADGLHVLVHLYYSTYKDVIRAAVLATLRTLIKGLSGTSSTDSGKPRPVLDIRNILDDPVEQAKFSLSVSSMDGYKPARPRQERRRRSRRGDQIVEPKPTHRSLSMENLRKGMTDDSDSDSDDEYGGRWTSETDGDTDGEPLLKDSTTLPKHLPQLTDLTSERYYVQTHNVGFKEDETHDFRSQTNIHDVSKRPIAKSLCAFLNIKTRGTVYVGVNKDGVVAGVRIRRKERDLLRLGIDEMVDRFKPSIKHDMYKMEFVPIVRPSGSESSISRQYVDDRFIVEISIVKCTGQIYTTPNGKCYFRNKSANIEMNTQEVRERTIDEQETLYNSKFKLLHRQLKDMRKQLSKSNNEGAGPEAIEQAATAVKTFDKRQIVTEKSMPDSRQIYTEKSMPDSRQIVTERLMPDSRQIVTGKSTNDSLSSLPTNNSGGGGGEGCVIS